MKFALHEVCTVLTKNEIHTNLYKMLLQNSVHKQQGKNKNKINQYNIFA